MAEIKQDLVIPVLAREDILAVSDIEIELVNVPEWGGSVYVKGMTGSERDQFESSIISLGSNGKAQKLNLTDSRAKLCSMTICDQTGKKLFSLADVKALTEKSAAALQRVFMVAQRLSGLGEEDIKELMEGLEERPFEGSASG